MTKGGAVQGRAFGDEKAIWRLVAWSCAMPGQTELGKLAPHDDLLGTCAQALPEGGRGSGALEQIQLPLSDASLLATERYLGTEQNLVEAVNDGLGLELG